jgi:hypothetical protein
MATLSKAEVKAGFRLIDGVKYRPMEAAKKKTESWKLVSSTGRSIPLQHFRDTDNYSVFGLEAPAKGKKATFGKMWIA